MNTEKPISQPKQPEQPVKEENENKSEEVEPIKLNQGRVYTYNICEDLDYDSDSEYFNSLDDSDDLEDILGQGYDHLWNDDY